MKKRRFITFFVVTVFAFCLFLIPAQAKASSMTLSLNTTYTLNMQQNESKTYILNAKSKYHRLYINGTSRYHVFINSGGHVQEEYGTNIDLQFYVYSNMAYIEITCEIASSSSSMIVRQMVASLYGWNYGDIDTKNIINTKPDVDKPYEYLSPLMDASKYTNVYTNNQEHMMATDGRGLKYIDSDVFFFSGHAGSTVLQLPGSYKDVWNSGSPLYGVVLPQLSVCKLAVCAGCETAKNVDSGYNIANQFVINGAAASIGWKKQIAVDSSRKFTNRLFEEMCVNGKTLSEAATIAKNQFLIGNIKNYVIYGNSNLKLKYIIFNSKAAVNDLIKSEEEIFTGNFDDYYVETIDNNCFRLFKKINNYKTNEFVDVKNVGGNYYIVNKSKVSLNNKTILEINNNALKHSLYDIFNEKTTQKIETEIIYIIRGENVVPVLYLGVMHINNNDYQDILINMNNGDILDYEEYAII